MNYRCEGLQAQWKNFADNKLLFTLQSFHKNGHDHMTIVGFISVQNSDDIRPARAKELI